MNDVSVNPIGLKEHMAFLETGDELATQNAYSDRLEDAGNDRGAFFVRASNMLDNLEEALHMECAELGELVHGLTGGVMRLNQGPDHDMPKIKHTDAGRGVFTMVFEKTTSIAEDAEAGRVGPSRVKSRFDADIEAFLDELNGAVYDPGVNESRLEIPFWAMPALKQFLSDQVRDNPELKVWDLTMTEIAQGLQNHPLSAPNRSTEMSHEEVEDEVREYPWYEDNLVRLKRLRDAIQVPTGWSKEEYYDKFDGNHIVPVENYEDAEDWIYMTLRSEDYVVEVRLIAEYEDCHQRLWLFRNDKKLPTFEEACGVARTILPDWVEFSKGAMDNEDYHGEVEMNPNVFNGFILNDGVIPEWNPSAQYAIMLHLDLNDMVLETK